MPIPKNKNELVDAIDENFEKLERAVDAVPPQKSDLRTMEGHAKGTTMSPSDLLAYLIGWNHLVLKWLDDDDAGRAVAFPLEGFGWNELGSLAQKFYQDYEAVSFEEKRALLSQAYTDILEQLEKRTNDELYGQAWYRKYTKGRMIQLNTAAPYNNATARLRKWLKAL